MERVLELLANAPVAREAWRRRRLLVASRAQPRMFVLRTRKKLVHEGWMTFWLRARQQKREELMELMGSVLGLAEDGVFRTMVGFCKGGVSDCMYVELRMQFFRRGSTLFARLERVVPAICGRGSPEHGVLLLVSPR